MAPFSEEEIYKMHKIRKTMLEMLHDRGYDISHLDVGISKDEFRRTHQTRKDLEIHVAKMENPADQIYIFFPDEEVFRVTTLKNYVTTLSSAEASRAIVVVQKKLNPLVKAAINEVSATIRFEVFEELDLMFNVTKHELVPKHEVLTDEEKSSVLEELNLKEDQLPVILTKDPNARYFGVKIGQVMKITRPSLTAGTSVAYRIVKEE